MHTYMHTYTIQVSGLSCTHAYIHAYIYHTGVWPLMLEAPSTGDLKGISMHDNDGVLYRGTEVCMYVCMYAHVYERYGISMYVVIYMSGICVIVKKLEGHGYA